MINQLEYLDEFKEVLRHYHVSEAGRSTLQKTNLVLLVAPSAIGRNTIVAELLKTGTYHFIVSDTTRKPRINNGILEQNGVEYWFRKEADVLEDLRQGKFLEAAVIHEQQVSGISLREIEKAHEEGRVALNDIEIVGMGNIIAAKPDAHAIFVLPPNFEKWMERMDGRGVMLVEEKRRRLVSAEKEFEVALKHNYYRFVMNDSVKQAAADVEAITRDEIDATKQRELHAVVEQLLQETKDWLKQNP